MGAAQKSSRVKNTGMHQMVVIVSWGRKLLEIDIVDPVSSTDPVIKTTSSTSQSSMLHRPQAEGVPEQGGLASDSEVEAANTLSFFCNWFAPQAGQGVPDQSCERTSIS